MLVKFEAIYLGLCFVHKPKELMKIIFVFVKLNFTESTHICTSIIYLYMYEVKNYVRSMQAWK